MPQQKLTVMISSTARDLPEHRKELVEACLRQDAFPLRMEDLPANSDEAAAASLKMVEAADIYVGVFANRYGYVPKVNNPDQVSVTEMEYNRAVERKIERLIFIMDKTHPITVDDVEIENAAKLKAFKERVGAENIVRFFKSPADLRAEAINSLSKLRQPDLTKFHYISDIPQPPEPFIAHPYTLLQSPNLIGRQSELKLLTDWVTGKDLEFESRKAAGDSVRIMNVVAIGGLGKSALTWKWFNDVAPKEMKPLAGRMWWSFYESDATFENFVTRALAYVTKRPLDEVQQIPASERESQLLGALNRGPFLIVLDGLERLLSAYARIDAALSTDDHFDRQTSNSVANAYGLLESVTPSFMREHLLRRTADPRTGSFLRKLTGVKSARLLISTRLYPAELQTLSGEPLLGSSAFFLQGLKSLDALSLWRSCGASGKGNVLLPLFDSFENHPLVIQVLAGEIARYRPRPGDFDTWLRDHPHFDPSGLPLVQVKSHVLEFGLRGLEEDARQALQVIAAFRIPARYDTLAALLMREAVCADEHELDEMLTELEDRGLIGWDKRANRYDLHPIVRGVVWKGLSDDKRRRVYEMLHAHFGALPKIDDYLRVNNLEDLTPAIELYNTLIGLGRYDDAVTLFYGPLNFATLYRLHASWLRVELLKMLFPDGLGTLPRLSNRLNQARVLQSLGQGYQSTGQPGLAAPLISQHNTICEEMGDEKNLITGLQNLSQTLRFLGALRESEAAVRGALLASRAQYNNFDEAITLYWFGLTLAEKGRANQSRAAFQRSLRMFVAQSDSQAEGVVNSHLARRALWLEEFASARSFGNRAWELAHLMKLEGDFIRAASRQGQASLGLNDLSAAEERLLHALTRSRATNFVQEELPVIVALGDLRRRQRDLKGAREFLDDVWEPAERGPYPVFHADACNVLAQIERDEGNTGAAVEAATKAYRLAWCDGPPFAYHWGLEKAKKHFKELGAPEPEMPPFDESKFEPMPEVEIDPDDEFHVGNASDS
jgi:tetratricopeptide (TPR) repeat protein